MLTAQQFWLAIFRVALFAIGGIALYLTFSLGAAVLLLLVPLAAFGMLADRLYVRAMRTSRERSDESAAHVRELTEMLSEQERIGRSLVKSEERFRNAFDHASVGMALVSISGKIWKVNRSLAGMLGRDGAELCDTATDSIIDPSQFEAFQRRLSALSNGEVASCQMEIRLRPDTDKEIWALWSASMVRDAHIERPHFIFQFQDITDRKRAEQQLIHDALHDALTGLPNRVLFMDRLEVAFRRAKRHFDNGFAVLYLDFDRFKFVNDSLGHSAGDALLVEISARLASILRNSDTVARLGGDEFAVLVEDIESIDEAIQFIERIRSEIARPFELEGRQVFTTASIGIAPWDRSYERPEFLLRDADAALYQAKRRGRDRFEVFSEELHAEAMNFLRNESDLRRAIDNEEFRAFYQPIVSIETGGLAGFEALIRWEHPERGFVSPAEFIPIAEETGMIFPIGEWILREACRQTKAWQERFGNSGLWVSVNVSSKQFTQSDLYSIVTETLQDTGLSPDSLKLEITESMMSDNLESVVEVMARLEMIGVKLSIDDFGTGYSSLSNLHTLPLSSLKIDRAFVQQMDQANENGEIIRAIVSLAHSLNLEIIAEGVETATQLRGLVDLNCEMAQGYLFSKPLDADAAGQFISESGIQPDRGSDGNVDQRKKNAA